MARCLSPLSQFIKDFAIQFPDPTEQQVLDIKTEAMRHFGASREQVQYAIKNLRKTSHIPSNWGFNVGTGITLPTGNQNDPTPMVINKTAKITTVNSGLQGFRKLYDKTLTIPTKIQEGIDSVLLKNGWMYDDDFRRACGVKTTDWRRFAREFENLQLRVDGGVLVWGHPSIIDEMREVALG